MARGFRRARVDNKFVVERKAPAYLSLTEDELAEKAKQARELASPCVLCGRRCSVMRFGEDVASDRARAIGFCKTGERAVVSSYGPHFGEEPPLTGTRGSGTIFFSYCNLRCIFCQNYEVAHLGEGHEVSDRRLADMMVRVQEIGCHNVNLVSPTHVVPSILAALRIAAVEGLSIPVVYNTGGYDSVETIRLLEGVVDIYMPDMKYGDAEAAQEFSLAADYPAVNFAAVKEMHRQTGDLVTDDKGIAVRGLLVRHLVLPGGAAGTERVMQFIAEEISVDTYVNIMDQYEPYFRAKGHKKIGRPVTPKEHRQALEIAERAGLRRVQS